MPRYQLDALMYGYGYADRYYIDDLSEPKPETGDINYVYLKGQGWVPETPNVIKLLAKQEQEVFSKRIQAQQERIMQRQRARAVNFGFEYGRADIEQRMREMAARLREVDWYTAPAGNQANMPTQPAEPVTWTTQTLPVEDGWYGTRRWWGDTTERWAEPAQEEPREHPRRAAEPVTTRYYPGSGVRVEAAPAPNETPAERRAREWIEARRRWGRR